MIKLRAFNHKMHLDVGLHLNEHEITIKSLYFTSDARRDDSSVLTKTEQYLLRVLERHFPLDSGKYENRPYMRKRFDSLLAIYPQLRDVNYYWSLETKRLVPDTNAKVKITKISITRKDFYHIVSVINASGYWKMPWKIACDSYPTDGYGFTLEANTTKKYNYVELGSCTDNTPMQVAFEKACQELVHYAKLDKEISLVSDWKIDSVHIDSARWKHL